MRGWLTFVVVGVALMTTPGWAQMRGARVGPHASRGPINGFHAQGFHGAAVSRPSFRSGFSPRFHSDFRSGFRPPFRHHHRGFGIVWPFDYGYPGYYPSYPLFGNGYDSAENEQNYQQQEIPQMSNEVEALHDQQTQLRPPQSERRNEATSMPTTTLVFRNGKTQQVLNYSIAGQTLWVFNEQREMKIPLSELDVPATQALNEEHGVSFQIPPAR